MLYCQRTRCAPLSLIVASRHRRRRQRIATFAAVPVRRSCAWARCAVELLTPSTDSGEALKVTIDAELEAHILRLYHVEKWRCGTIARA